MSYVWFILVIVGAFAGVSLVLSIVVLSPLLLLRRIRVAYRLCVAGAAVLTTLGAGVGILAVADWYPITAAKSWLQAIGLTSTALGPGLVGWVLERRLRRS